MTKKRKIALAVGIPIAIPTIALLGILYSYIILFSIDFIGFKLTHIGWTQLDYCEEQWEISLPKGATIEYNYSNRGGFLGDGTEYTVCKYSYCPDNVLEYFKKDSDGKYAEKYNNIISLLQKSDIDKSKLFTPNENIIWQSKIMRGNNTLLLAFNKQTYTLYIIEHFM